MPQKEPSYWLMKSEPDAYSIDDLKNDEVTLWDGIRNYQFFKNLAIIKGSLFISQKLGSFCGMGSRRKFQVRMKLE